MQIRPSRVRVCERRLRPVGCPYCGDSVQPEVVMSNPPLMWTDCGRCSRSFLSTVEIRPHRDEVVSRLAGCPLIVTEYPG